MVLLSQNLRKKLTVADPNSDSNLQYSSSFSNINPMDKNKKKSSKSNLIGVTCIGLIALSTTAMAGYFYLSMTQKENQFAQYESNITKEKEAILKDREHLRDSLEYTLFELHKLRMEKKEETNEQFEDTKILVNRIQQRQQEINKHNNTLLELLSDPVLLKIIQKKEKEAFRENYSSLFDDLNQVLASRKAQTEQAALLLQNNPLLPDFSKEELSASLMELEALSLKQRTIIGAIANTLEGYLEKKSERLRKFGLNNIDEFPGKNENAIGGPYIAANSELDPYFTHHTERIDLALAHIDYMQGKERGLPLGYPITNVPVSSSYGYRNDPFLNKRSFHGGIDFAARTGTKVYSTADGIVSYARHNGGYGNMVEIDHGNGYVTRYAHLSRIKVKKGMKVDKSTLIGLVGNTGRSTGAHLHYEVRKKGRPLNPRNFLYTEG